MKLTILLGYPKTDPSGHPQGAPKIISGPPADEADAREQARLFTDAKQLHQFPKGIKHLVYGQIEILDRAAYISDEIADQIQGRQQQRLADIEAQEKRRAALIEKSNAVAAAKQRISAAAVAHNNAAAALQTAKNLALDAEANWKHGNKTESLGKILDAAKQKVIELTLIENTARAELQAAKEGRPAVVPPVSILGQQTLQEPEEFKGKTDDELRAVVAALDEAGKQSGKAQIQLAPNATRDQIITAIVQATEKDEARKQPGFFSRFFSKK